MCGINKLPRIAVVKCNTVVRMKASPVGLLEFGIVIIVATNIAKTVKIIEDFSFQRS
jgi:hypothetical protein